MPEILSEIGDMEYKHLISSVHRVVSLIKVFKSTILTPQHLSGARLVEQRALALLKQWTLDNVITLTSDDLHNIRDHSRNSMDVSCTCTNRTLRESSVSHSNGPAHELTRQGYGINHRTLFTQIFTSNSPKLTV